MKQKKAHTGHASPLGERPAASLYLPPYVAYALMAVWGWFVVSKHLATYPVSPEYFIRFFEKSSAGFFLPNILPALAAAAGAFALLWSAFGLGRLILDLVRRGSDPSAGATVAAGLGCVAFAYYTLAIGSIGLLRPLPAVLPVAAGFAYGVYTVRKTGIKRPALFSRTGYLTGSIALFSLVLLVYAAAAALVPETFYDSLHYHLALPAYWILHHRIETLDFFSLSYYPVNIHMLYTLGLMFVNETAPKLVHFGLGLLSAAAVYGWTRRRFRNRTAALAAALIFTVPFVTIVMWRSVIEMGLAFFETLAVLSLLNYLENEEAAPPRFWLVLSGIFCGAAMGGKYLSAFALFGLLGMLALAALHRRRGMKRFLVDAALLGAVALTVVSPYLVRNFSLTGNPTYPYGISLTSEATTVVKDKVVEFNDPPPTERTLRNFLTLPWTLTMGKKTLEPFSGAAWLLCLPLLLLFRKLDPRVRLLIAYFVIYYLCWFFVRSYFRYLLPLAPVAGILCAYAVSETAVNRYARSALLAALLVLGLSAGAMVVQTAYLSLNPFLYLRGGISRADYLSTQRLSYPDPYFETIEWANGNLPPQAKIFFLGEARGFYSRRDFVTFPISDANPLAGWVRGCADGDAVYAMLKSKGITHFLVNAPELRRLAGYDIAGFDYRGLSVFTQFWNKYVRELRSDVADLSLPEKGILSLRSRDPEFFSRYAADPRNRVHLFEIMPPAEAAAPHRPPFNILLDGDSYPPERREQLQKASDNLNKGI